LVGALLGAFVDKCADDGAAEGADEGSAEGANEGADEGADRNLRSAPLCFCSRRRTHEGSHVEGADEGANERTLAIFPAFCAGLFFRAAIASFTERLGSFWTSAKAARSKSTAPLVSSTSVDIAKAPAEEGADCCCRPRSIAALTVSTVSLMLLLEII
jgi:hypothetical protein